MIAALAALMVTVQGIPHEGCVYDAANKRMVLSPVLLAEHEAQAQPWFKANTKIVFRKGLYSKYGLPRPLPEHLNSMALAFHKANVPIFTVEDASAKVLYVFSASEGCVFQPYQRDVATKVAPPARRVAPSRRK
jgi:hypothetical protein